MFADVSDAEIWTIGTTLLGAIGLVGLLLATFGIVGLVRRRVSVVGNHALTGMSALTVGTLCLLLGSTIVAVSGLVWFGWVKVNLIP
jgi:hypothetical protein